MRLFHKRRPKVSALMPLYNTKPEHLHYAIKSILGQKFQDWELILLNDSPDNKTLKPIVRTYNDRRIRYYTNRKNMGISGARNKLMDLARGEYYAVCDHDDISMPDRFGLCVEYLDAHKEVGAVAGQYVVNGNWDVATQSASADMDIRKTMIAGWYNFAHQTSMLRASVIKEHNIRYEWEFSPVEDQRLMSQLMKYTRFYDFPWVFIDYNWDGDNTTIRYGQDGFDAIEHIRFLVKNDYPYSTFAEFIEPKITALGERMERIETLLSELKENHN